MNKNHISAFDLDHTLLTVNSSYVLGSYLYDQEVFPLTAMLNLTSTYFMHKAGFLGISKLHRRVFQAIFAGRATDTIIRHIDPLLDRQLESMLYAPAIEKLQEAQEQGHYTVILSSSPDFLVQNIAKRLKVDDWKASQYKVVEGTFQEITKVFKAEDKVGYLESLMEKLNIIRECTTAYSDSYLDLPFLVSAGTAVGVNPEKKLLALCKRKRWAII